jgi:hypothetical protein
MEKSTLEYLLSTYNGWIEAGTVVVVVGIVGEVAVDLGYEWKHIGWLRRGLTLFFGLLVAGGVGAEFWYGRKVVETSKAIQGQADRDVEEAREAALQALPLSKVRMIATEENAEAGNSEYLKPLQKFAGIHMIVEDSGEEDAPRAAGEIRKTLNKMGWILVKPIPRKTEFGYGVVLQWYEVSPYEVGRGGILIDPTAQCDQQNAQEAARSLLDILKANDWPGLTMSPQDASFQLKYRIPRNTVRVSVGPKPGAWLSNPLVAKWKADFQEVLENAARQKAQSAAH